MYSHIVSLLERQLSTHPAHTQAPLLLAMVGAQSSASFANISLDLSAQGNACADGVPRPVPRLVGTYSSDSREWRGDPAPGRYAVDVDGAFPGRRPGCEPDARREVCPVCAACFTPPAGQVCCGVSPLGLSPLSPTPPPLTPSLGGALLGELEQLGGELEEEVAHFFAPGGGPQPAEAGADEAPADEAPAGSAEEAAEEADPEDFFGVHGPPSPPSTPADGCRAPHSFLQGTGLTHDPFILNETLVAAAEECCAFCHAHTRPKCAARPPGPSTREAACQPPNCILPCAQLHAGCCAGVPPGPSTRGELTRRPTATPLTAPRRTSREMQSRA